MNAAGRIFSIAALVAGAMAYPALCPAASSVMQQQGSGPGYERLQTLQAQAEAALGAGDAHKTSALAAQLLRENTDKSSWNYGNVVYDANQLLGLAALREGNIKAADQYLLAAGRTLGSPQLDSFGPKMPLAQALYARGQKSTVQSFLNLIIKFWGTTKPGGEKYKSLDESKAAKIHQWQAEITAGKTPSLNRLDFVAGVPSGASDAPAEPLAPPLLAVGAAAPDFAVQDKAGKTIRLSDYKGKVVVLDFWSTWCGPCQASLPHTSSVARKFAGQNVVVLAVNVWDTQAAFDAWLPKHAEYNAIQFAIDPTKAQGQDVASRLYHVSGIPTQYVISPAGKVTKSFVGFGGPTNDLAQAVTAAMRTASLPPAP